MELLNKLTTKAKEIEKAQEELTKSFRENSKDIFKELFDAVPNLKTVQWTQYTPYFNDGEECVFDVNSISFANFLIEDLTDEDEEDYYEGCLSDTFSVDDESIIKDLNIKVAVSGSYSDNSFENGERDYYKHKGDNIRLLFGDNAPEIFKGISDFIENNEDIVRALYGDHSIVTVTKEGVEVEEYDHE